MIAVLAVDPGLATGIALVDRQSGELLYSAELQRDELEKAFEHYCEYYEPGQLGVVIEKFIITPQTAKNSQAPWSLMNIGVFSYISRKNGHGEPELQTAASAKSFVSNDRLRSLKLWHKGGGGHANDALRHAVLFMVNDGWRPEGLIAES